MTLVGVIGSITDKLLFLLLLLLLSQNQPSLHPAGQLPDEVDCSTGKGINLGDLALSKGQGKILQPTGIQTDKLQNQILPQFKV